MLVLRQKTVNTGLQRLAVYAFTCAAIFAAAIVHPEGGRLGRQHIGAAKKPLHPGGGEGHHLVCRVGDGGVLPALSRAVKPNDQGAGAGLYLLGHKIAVVQAVFTEVVQPALGSGHTVAQGEAEPQPGNSFHRLNLLNIIAHGDIDIVLLGAGDPGGEGAKRAVVRLQGDKSAAGFRLALAVGGVSFFHRDIALTGDKAVPLGPAFGELVNLALFVQPLNMDGKAGGVHCLRGNRLGEGENNFGDIGSKIRDFGISIIASAHWNLPRVNLKNILYLQYSAVGGECQAI